MEPKELTVRREALGLSITKLAQEFRVNPSSVQRWEAGEVVLQGLMAIGADTILKRLEREHSRRAPSAPPQGQEGRGSE